VMQDDEGKPNAVMQACTNSERGTRYSKKLTSPKICPPATATPVRPSHGTPPLFVPPVISRGQRRFELSSGLDVGVIGVKFSHTSLRIIERRSRDEDPGPGALGSPV